MKPEFKKEYLKRLKDIVARVQADECYCEDVPEDGICEDCPINGGDLVNAMMEEIAALE
jgi:hypothetical protein